MRTALLLTALILFIASCMASSHSESPSTAKSPNADITDLYAFRSYEAGRANFVTFIMNVYPLQNPNAGPNYYSISDNHFFEINIDNDGDGVEDQIYQFLYGNELGGPEGTFLQPSEDDPCANASLVNKTQHGGLTITVDNKPGRNGTNSTYATPIALKFIGPISNVYDANLNWIEYYTLNKITGSRTNGVSAPINRAGNASFTTFPKPFDNAGQKTFDPTTNPYSTYAAAHEWDIDVPGCSTAGSRVFVGQRAESFSIQLGKIFDLINLVPVAPGSFPTNPTVGVADCDSNNELAKNNIASLVLELPISCVLSGQSGQSPVIGVWGTVRKMVHVGADHIPTIQVSRLGNPLVNELVIGLKDKPIWSQLEPIQDTDAQYNLVPYVTHPSLPAIIDALFLQPVRDLSGLGNLLVTLAPNVPRLDLVQVFFAGVPGLTAANNPGVLVEYIRLNTSTALPTTQNNLGVIGGDVAGYPNGRRPGDDVVDISLRVMMGVLCTINLNCTSADAPVGSFNFTDGAPQNAGQFQTAFPYLNTPYPGGVTDNNADECSNDDSSNNSNGGSTSSSNSATGTASGDGNDDGDAAARVNALIAANIHNLRKVILGH